MVKIKRISAIWHCFIVCFIVLVSFFQVGCGSFQVIPQKQNITIGSKSAVVVTAKNIQEHGSHTLASEKEAIPAVESINASQKMAFMPIAPNYITNKQSTSPKAVVTLRNEMKIFTVAAKHILADSTQPTEAQQREIERLAKGKKRAIIGAILATLGVGGSAGAIPVILIPFAMYFCISALHLLKKGDKGRGWATFGLVISSLFLLLVLLVILYLISYGI